MRRYSPNRHSRGTAIPLRVAPALLLAMPLMAVALAACGGGSPDADRERATARPRTVTGDAEPTRRGIFGRTGSESTDCVRRRPGPNVMAPPAQTSPETDKEALLALFEATGGDSWDGSSTWAGRAPIGEWAGVSSGDDGRVIALQLSGLTGELSPELGNLTGLRTLEISNSQLAELPSELGNLTGLENLLISSSQLTGELPPELGNLTGLRILRISGSQLGGQLPRELGNLTNLEQITLSENEFCWELPPELGGLASLQLLNLEGNQLTGELPPELDNLAFALSSIRLDGNQLGGCISDLLRDYVGGYNSSGAIPICTPEDHPGDTEALIALHNAWGQPSINNWLSREPIGEWEGVSVNANGRVAALNLAGRGLTGELPPELGSLASLQLLNLGRNQLTGELPPELGSLANLEYLDLNGNELTGSSGKCVPNLRLSLPISILAPLGELCLTGGEFASVSAGYNHTCGVSRAGAVACWGSNNLGKATPPAGEFTSVSAGAAHTCGVKRNGAVACWGWNNYGQATPPAGEFTSVSAGTEHTCGVKGDGAVACWGSGYQAGG